MIVIKELNKVYKSRKNKKCHALKDINLTLPDTGLVFVLGKSGSGKSTLLNLIGGLDNITSGEIFVDGNDLSHFNEKEFCNYRNTHIGFIFQDYHLLDELTVFDNIMLSLNLNGEEDKEKVLLALEKVGLSGYEDRFTQELSGGEQQRVAIARAIVKNPKVILADEPTGNLDSSTSKQIIAILQEISKSCLILIVSHNINDANKYADRIIELKQGEIIDDKNKNPLFLDHVSLKNGKLVYPSGLELSEDDISLINNFKDTEMVMNKDKFIQTKVESKEMIKKDIQNKKLKFRNELKVSYSFLKNKIFTILISSFMVAVIMVIYALAQTIISFEGEKLIEKEMTKLNQDYMLLNKSLDESASSLLEKTYRVKIDEEDISTFYDLGYNGKIYPVYNYSLPIRNTATFYGVGNTHFYKKVYLSETFGMMLVDDEFMKNKFGDLDFVLKADKEKTYGVYLTDYTADSMLAISDMYAGRTYKDLIGYIYIPGYACPYMYVNGIIDTGYKEKYGELIDDYQNGKISDSNIYNDSRFITFSNDIYDYLGYTFSTNPNFFNDLDESGMREFVSHYKLNINSYDYYKSGLQLIYEEKKLANKSVIFNIDDYNQIFNTDYNVLTAKSFVPHTITLSHYEYNDLKNENELFKVEVTITSLKEMQQTMYVSSDVFELFENECVKIYSLYFEGTEGIMSLLDTAVKLDYEYQSLIVEAVYTMIRAVEVFVPMFRLIAVVICAGVILIFVNFSIKMIKDKMHEIGILKALGTKNRSIVVIFGLHVALITILTCLMSILGYLIFIDLANDVLVESLTKLASHRVILNLEFLTFKPKIALINCIMIIILAIISLLPPMIRIKKIKPVKIIKTRD